MLLLLSRTFLALSWIAMTSATLPLMLFVGFN